MYKYKKKVGKNRLANRYSQHAVGPPQGLGRKEGKKERKKERKGAPVRRLVRARNINFYEERLGFYVRREAGLEKVLWTVRSLQNNFFCLFFKRP